MQKYQRFCWLHRLPKSIRLREASWSKS